MLFIENGLINFMKVKFCVILSIFAIFCTICPVFAQQTVITIPSSDVLPFGHMILKQSNRFSPFGEGFVSLTPNVIFGTGKDTEISFGVGTSIRDRTDVKLDMTAKKVFRIKKSTRLTVGGRLQPSLTEGENPDSMVYAHTSFLVKKTRTTLTAGTYVAGYAQMPDSTGVMLGIDQTIIPNKLRIVADWMSRQDSGCALAAGMKYRPVPATSITTAVVIPNNSEDRVAFSVSVSQYLGRVLPEKKKDGEEL